MNDGHTDHTDIFLTTTTPLIPYCKGNILLKALTVFLFPYLISTHKE